MKHPPVARFWWLILAVAILGVLGEYGVGRQANGVGVALFVLVLASPVVQLVSAFLVFVSRRIDLDRFNS